MVYNSRFYTVMISCKIEVLLLVVYCCLPPLLPAAAAAVRPTSRDVSFLAGRIPAKATKHLKSDLVTRSQ